MNVNKLINREMHLRPRASGVLLVDTIVYFFSFFLNRKKQYLGFLWEISLKILGLKSYMCNVMQGQTDSDTNSIE